MLNFLFYFDKYKNVDSYLECTGHIITGRFHNTLHTQRDSPCNYVKFNFIFVIAFYFSLLGNSDLWCDNLG